MDGFLAGVMVGAGGIGLLLLLIFIARPWLHAFLSGAAVPMFQIVAMRLRGLEARIKKRSTPVPAKKP